MTGSAGAHRARQAHAAWYAGIGTELETSWIGPGQGAKLNDAERDLANIREAAAHAIAHRDAQLLRGLVLLPAAELWWATGRLDEGIYWLRRTLAVAGLDHEVLVRVLVLAATFAYGLRLLDEGDEHIDRLTRLIRGSGDPYARGARAYAAGFGQIQRGDAREAVRTLRTSVLIAASCRRPAAAPGRWVTRSGRSSSPPPARHCWQPLDAGREPEPRPDHPAFAGLVTSTSR